jgi:hypothetical protein
MYINFDKLLAVVETDQGWTLLFEGGEKVEWVLGDCIQKILDNISKRTAGRT